MNVAGLGILNVTKINKDWFRFEGWLGTGKGDEKEEMVNSTHREQGSDRIVWIGLSV